MLGMKGCSLPKTKKEWMSVTPIFDYYNCVYNDRQTLSCLNTENFCNDRQTLGCQSLSLACTLIT